MSGRLEKVVGDAYLLFCTDCDEWLLHRYNGEQNDTEGNKLFDLYTCESCYTTKAEDKTEFYMKKYEDRKESDKMTLLEES